MIVKNLSRGGVYLYFSLIRKGALNRQSTACNNSSGTYLRQMSRSSSHACLFNLLPPTTYDTKKETYFAAYDVCCPNKYTCVCINETFSRPNKEASSSRSFVTNKGCPNKFWIPRACISEEKTQSQNYSIQHFEFSRTFFSIGSPVILPAGPLLLDCHCWKKCGKIQNVGSRSDFEIFSSEIYALTKLHLTYRSFRAQIHLTF